MLHDTHSTPPVRPASSFRTRSVFANERAGHGNEVCVAGGQDVGHGSGGPYASHQDRGYAGGPADVPGEGPAIGLRSLGVPASLRQQLHPSLATADRHIRADVLGVATHHAERGLESVDPPLGQQLGPL